MRINWPWVLAAITIAATCVAAVWLPFLLTSSPEPITLN